MYRTLALLIDLLLFGFVGWVSMSASPSRQRYGDRWAGTIVVHVDTLPPESLPSPVRGFLLGIAACGLATTTVLVLLAL